MTVIFAFTSKPARVSFLGADDREGFSGVRCDKVHCVLGRFLIGIFGSDVVEEAAGFAARLGPEPVLLRDFSTYKPPTSAEDFCRLVTTLLPGIVPTRERVLQRAITAGEYTEEQRATMYAQHGNLVLVDTQEYRIWHADFGEIFPARANYECRLYEYSATQAMRFGINEPTEAGHVTKEMLTEPFAWCRRRVLEARSEVEHHGFFGAIGELGACVFHRNGKLRSRTAYSSPFDQLQRYYPVQPETDEARDP